MTAELDITGAPDSNLGDMGNPPSETPPEFTRPAPQRMDRNPETGRKRISQDYKLWVAEQIRDLDLRYGEMARRLGVHRSHVSEWMRSIGLPLRRPPMPGAGIRPAEPSPKAADGVGPEPPRFERNETNHSVTSKAWKRWLVEAFKASGLSQGAFSKSVGLSQTEVSRHMREMGHRLGRNQRYPAEDQRRFAEMAKSYPTLKAAAKALGVSPSGLAKWVAKLDAGKLGKPRKAKQERAQTPTPPPPTVALSTEVLAPLARQSRAELEEEVADLREQVLLLRMIVSRAERKGLWSSTDLTAGLNFEKGRKG